MALRFTRMALDKSMFAAKRRVILPIHANPVSSAGMVKASYTTDALKLSIAPRFTSDGEAMREVTGAEQNLEGERSRRMLDARGDPEFSALTKFVSGAAVDSMISGGDYRRAYDALTSNDDVFIWLCHVAMSVLNPGDVRSRLMYRHLEALVKAVTSGEMSQRTAYRFYESAIRSPAYRQIADRQLETGAATRIAGICAAAEVMRKSGVCRRPMTSYFELFKRITERSEANTPWGFPPLLQFEERLQLPTRLQFFGRGGAAANRKRSKGKVTNSLTRLQGPRRFWLPPTWALSHANLMHPGFSTNRKLPIE